MSDTLLFADFKFFIVYIPLFQSLLYQKPHDFSSSREHIYSVNIFE